MKFIMAAVLAAALGMSAGFQARAQAATQIVGGYTATALTSTFVASTRGSGIFISDLNGNLLPNSASNSGELINNLGAVSGVIDLDTGETDVKLRGGFLINYIGRIMVRVDNLVLHANTTNSYTTGDFTKRGFPRASRDFRCQSES